MKDRTGHFLMILLVMIMSILTIATSVSTPQYIERMHYEIRDGYLFISINPINNINYYLDIYLLNIGIVIRPKGGRISEFQRFDNDYFNNQFVLTTSIQGRMFTNRSTVFFDDPLFKTFFEDNLLKIKMNTNLIKYEVFYVDSVSIYGRTNILLREIYR